MCIFLMVKRRLWLSAMFFVALKSLMIIYTVGLFFLSSTTAKDYLTFVFLSLLTK